MDGSKRKRKLGPYKKDLLTDDAIEKCLPSVTTYEGNLKLDTSEECLNIENVDFPSTSKSKEMKLNKEHLQVLPEYTEETVICNQVPRNNEEDFEEIPPQAEVGNDLNDSDSDLDELDFEDTMESMFNSDAELHFDDECFVGEREKNDEDEDQPLYPEAPISLGTFMLLFTSFTMKHSLSSDGILQLLNIFSYVLPKGHTLCTSLYDYKKFFTNLRNPLVKHFYCPHCLGYLKSSAELKCPYSGCEKELNDNEVMYFLEMPVESQLKILYAQTGFYEKLQHRFRRQSRDGIYEDVYDGSLYKSYWENDGPLSKPENISFTFNTDGAPVFKSSKVSIWPLFMVINELPYKLRMLKEHMILAGLWFGPHKPNMGTYLSPFLDCFKRLHEGIQCFAPSLGTFMCKAYLLFGTADLPARCLLCNGVQYNGSFSCWKCLQKGETAKRGKGHTHVFPYIPDQPKDPRRTVHDVCRDAQKAMDNLEKRTSNYTVNGVKGPSWLTFFPKFDIVNGIAIDYMHGVLLGVQKLLLRLWFAPEFNSKQFSIYKKVKEVDVRLNKLKPTLDISRLPRSIENDLKYWKASEYRNFLLYFGAPVLCGILDIPRFQHFVLLVNAISILLKQGSNENEISEAEKMLFDFCADFEILYEKCFMTLNVHQLVHLADSVRYLGPLYTHSCFSFEDKNGSILKMIQGTQYIDNQIITGISFVQKLPELKQKLVASMFEGSELEKLFNSIECPNLLKRGEMIEKGMYILGGMKLRNISDLEFRKLCAFLEYVPQHEKFSTFKRIDFNNHIIYGLDYARMMKRDNSTMMYMNENILCFGRVRFFLLVTIHGQRTVLAFLEKLKCNSYNSKCQILKVEKTNETEFVAMRNAVKDPGCIFLEVQDNNEQMCYVCRYLNKLESD